jgi:hypothetical protein|tara:strand:+ start:316 stop:522 length:207 start_codon:yes stop_codon:yes gene_type:complete
MPKMRKLAKSFVRQGTYRIIQIRDDNGDWSGMSIWISVGKDGKVEIAQYNDGFHPWKIIHSDDLKKVI